MGETTGADTTARGAPARPARGAPDAAVSADAITGGDLPTRMLVFGLARHDGTIPAAEVFTVAAACDRSPEQVRSCLRRLVAEGLFDRDGTGRRAVYRPTDDGLRALAAFGGPALRAHALDARQDGWDGRWHLVAFAVPEARRAARDALRDQLGQLGGACIHNGLYVSPHPWGKDVAATAEALDIGSHLTLAITDSLTVGGESDPRDVAARLWRLDALAGRYQAFLDRWSVVIDGLGRMHRRRERLAESTYLPGALAMGLAYRACLDADPLLPTDLLPHPWPGRAARDLIVRSRRLAQQVRADSDGPALFATFDDLVAALPGAGAGTDPGGPP